MSESEVVGSVEAEAEAASEEGPPMDERAVEEAIRKVDELDLNADSGVSTAASSVGVGTPSASASPTPSPPPPPLPPSSYASAASSGVENKGEVREVAEAEEEEEKEKEAFLPRRVIFEEERRHLEFKVLQAALDSNGASPSTRSVLTEIHKNYWDMRIPMRFHDFLDRSTQVLRIIKDRREMLNSWGLLKESVLRFGAVSLDAAVFDRPHPRSKGRRQLCWAYLWVSSPSGQTVVYDLVAVNKGHVNAIGSSVYFPSYFVRSDLLRWLRSPETIVFLGRGLREGGLGDFFPGVRVEAAVDEEEIFWWYTSLYGGEEEEERGKDLVKISESGVGSPPSLRSVLCLFAKGEDFETQAEEQYVAKYGEHGYKSKSGDPQWPYWRSEGDLYRDLHLPPEHRLTKQEEGRGLPWEFSNRLRFLFFHRGTLPFSLANRLILERYLEDGTGPQAGDANVRSAYWEFLGKASQKIRLGLTLRRIEKLRLKQRAKKERRMQRRKEGQEKKDTQCEEA